MDTLFFIMSKLIWALIAPGTWLAAGLGLVVLGLGCGWPRLTQRAACATLGFVLLVSLVPVGQLLLRPLELRYPVAPPMPEPTGIIVLGGGEDIDRSAHWGRPELNDGADRFTAALALARRYPEARVLFTGGSGAVRDLGSAATGASVARDFFTDQGLAAARLILEPRARNTAENATRSFALINPEPDDHWVLLPAPFTCPAPWRVFLAQAGAG